MPSPKYEGLQIIHYCNPENPQIINNQIFCDRVLSTDVQDNFAYVTSHCDSIDSGLISRVDVTIPESPVITGISQTSGIPYDICVLGDFAYIADGDNGLTVFFISNSTPDFVTNDSTGGHAQSVYVDGTDAYVAQGLDGIAIFDISDPYNPTLLSTYPTTGAKDVFVKNDYAYIADGERGLLILDVTDPNNPTYVAEVETGGFLTGIFVNPNNHYVYATDSQIGLIAIDITTVTNPYILGCYQMFTEPTSLTYYCSYALVIDNEGMKIIQVNP